LSQRLKNSVAIVTGASRGIGRSIAQAYAREGALLCLVARDKLSLEQLVDELALPANRIMTLALDVTDRNASFNAVNQVEAKFGHVDILVNNAGVYKSKSFLNYTPDDFQDMLDVNLFGVIHFTQA